MTEKEFQQELLELTAYMITSARGLLDEPASYGPFRLMDGASRLCGLLSGPGHEDRDFYSMLQNKIDERKFSVMSDLDEFKAMMDDAVLEVTRHLMGKSSSDKTKD